MTCKSLSAACLLIAALAGCDQLGIETPDKVAARQEAEGKAVGGACRHAGRALEDCYDMNRRASKAAIYAGWRDMDSYMRENNIAVVKPATMEEEEAKVSASAGINTNANAEMAAKSDAKNAGHPKKGAGGNDKPADPSATDTAHADKPAAKTGATKTS